MMYGSFKPPKIKTTEDVKYTAKEVERITREWNEVTERLRNSGADLSRILLVGK
jgi:hypothetical protein